MIGIRSELPRARSADAACRCPFLVQDAGLLRRWARRARRWPAATGTYLRETLNETLVG